jgi:hypothetical protein
MSIITTDRQGHLCADVPRLLYALLAAVFGVAAAAIAAAWRILDIPAVMPASQWWITAVLCALSALFAAQALWGNALVFDAQRGELMRGSAVVSRFADVNHVELREVRADNHAYWRIYLHLAGGRSLFLGRDGNDVEADIAAARLAKVLSKPVKYVVM